MSRPQPFTAHSLGWLLLLGALTGLGPVSIDLYLPAFTLIENDLGQGIENTLAAYMFGVAIGQLVYGPVSDRFGRKPPLYVALVLYVLGSLGCAFADNMTALTLSRLLQALGGCAGVVIARAVVRDCCEAHEAARVFSTLILVTAVGPIVSPLLGSFITAAGSWRTLFHMQAVLGAVLLVVVHFTLEETGSVGSTLSIRKVLDTYADLLKDRSFAGHALLCACAIAVIFCYISIAPTLLSSIYGLSPLQLALLVGLNGMSFVLGSQLNLHRLRRHSPAAILRLAVWVPVFFAGATLLTNWSGPSALWLLVLLQVGIFVGTGHIGPNATAEALAHQGKRTGAASALLGSIQSVGSTLAGFATAIFCKGDVQAMALLMLVASLAMLAAHHWLVSSKSA